MAEGGRIGGMDPTSQMWVYRLRGGGEGKVGSGVKVGGRVLKGGEGHQWG